MATAKKLDMTALYATPRIETLIEEVGELQRQIAAMTTVLDHDREELRAFIGDHETLYDRKGREVLATYLMSATTLFDRKAFEYAHPALAAQYVERRNVRRLLVK